MHTTNAIILCLVSYPCIVAWVIYKNRFVDYLFLALLTCLGSIFSVVLYKQPDYSLTIYQAVAVGYAAVIGVWGVVEPKRQLSGSIEWSITGKSIS